jgi:hypothetical protein
LSEISEDYLPRTNYGPNLPDNEYNGKITACAWDPTKKQSDFYRLALRRMVALSGERSLISAIIPPKMMHIFNAPSVAFAATDDLLDVSAVAFSIVADFLIKAAGFESMEVSRFSLIPKVDLGHSAKIRVLRLSCLNNYYADLWNQNNDLEDIEWSQNISCLSREKAIVKHEYWSKTAGLRSDFSRRLALVELDVIVSIKLGLSLEQLLSIFSIHFPVLKQNENATWYDQNGRIVWTCSKGLAGVGFLNEKGSSPSSNEWISIVASNPSELFCTAIDDTMPDGPKTVERRFVGPFFKCDRIEDYERAWANFEKLEQEGKL